MMHEAYHSNNGDEYTQHLITLMVKPKAHFMNDLSVSDPNLVKLNVTLARKIMIWSSLILHMPQQQRKLSWLVQNYSLVWLLYSKLEHEKLFQDMNSELLSKKKWSPEETAALTPRTAPSLRIMSTVWGRADQVKQRIYPLLSARLQ